MQVRFAAVFLALFVCSSSFAGSFPISEPRIGPSPGLRRNVKIAASDEQYLVAWQDARGESFAPRPWAARVTREGEVVDILGLPLDDASLSGYYVDLVQSVASDGRDFLVATQRNDDRLRFIKVTREGLVQPAPDPGFTGRYGRLVWLGNTYAYFFDAPLDERTVKTGGRVAILDRHGNVLSAPRVIVPSNSNVYDLSVTISPDGSQSLLMATNAQNNDIFVAAAPVSAIRNGTLTVTMNVAARTDAIAYSLSAASSPSAHFLVWEESGKLFGRVYHGSTPAGAKFPIADAAGDPASVTWNGSRFVVAYDAHDAYRRIAVAELDESGTLLSTPLRQTTYGADIASASLGGDTLVAWGSVGGGSPDQDVHADIVRGSTFLHPAEGFVVSQSLPRYELPQALWRGDHYLAAWAEVSTGYRAAIGRFDAQGRPLDGPGRLLADASFVRLATDGHDALAVWQRSETLHLSQIAHDGTVKDRQIAAQWYGRPDVIWNGEEYAFCSSSLIGTAAADGTIRQTAQRDKISETCDLVWTGTQYVTFWTESEFCFPFCRPPTSIYAQAYSRQLVAIGAPAKLVYPDVDLEPFYVFRAAVSGGRTLIVWRTTEGILRGVRIGRSGLLLDPLNGFEIGAAANLGDVFPDRGGWSVQSGPYVWTITDSVSARQTRYPFVPDGAEAITVRGGPAPLVIHQTLPSGGEQVRRLLGHFVVPPRQRTVRH